MKNMVVRILQNNLWASLMLLNITSAFSKGKRSHKPVTIPKRIYSLWLQGIDEAPGIVQLNWARWKSLNPEYSLVLLDARQAESIIGDFPIPLSSLSPQAFSDVLRAKLLSENGGVWVDASLYPILPLNKWLGSYMKNSNFFAYSSPGKDRLLASWFLASEKNCLIMEAWWKTTRDYWYKPRTLITNDKNNIRIPELPVDVVNPDKQGSDNAYCYFWFHYLFAYNLAKNSAFRHEWERSERRPASLANTLKHLFKNNSRPRPWNIVSAARMAEVQKLDWRQSYPLDILSRI